MGNELSTTMDDEGNFVKPNKQNRPGNPQQGGSGGWDDGGFSQNGPPQNGYGHNGYPPNGYSQNGYLQNGGGYNSYPPPPGPPQGPPPGHGAPNDFAPPPGPPPGHANYGPPGAPPGAPPQQYAPPPGAPPPGYPAQQYGPPPGAPQQQQNGQSNSGGNRSKLGFPSKFEVWSEMCGDGETYMFIGETLDKTAYSAKMPTVSGRLAFTAGNRKANGTPLGEAKDVGMKRSSAVITLPNGFSCDLAKNSMTQVGKTTYTYTVPIDGRGKETFEWRMNPKNIGAMLKGGGPGAGFRLFRQGDEKPLAVFKDFAGLGMSSKMEMGTFEFVGEGASGQLGKLWATVTVLALLKAKQKQAEKEVIKAITSGI